MKLLYFTLLAYVSSFVLCEAEEFNEPTQIHLAYGDEDDSMTVTWSTLSNTVSHVRYGLTALDLVAMGYSRLYVDGGTEKRRQYIHRVTLRYLKPGRKYIYHCGSPEYWSDLLTFVAKRTDKTWAPRLALYGDLGMSHATSLGDLQTAAQMGKIDAVLHVGDMAYDMADDNARVGDEFMKQIQAIAGYVPYMVCPGNHENHHNFSNYRARFTMPGIEASGSENLFHSFNIGPIHFVAFSTETTYFADAEFGTQQIWNQFKWLEEDLKKANTPEARAKRPWLITMGHRPMYCSNKESQVWDGQVCVNLQNRVRVGWPPLKAPGFEDLFYKYGVDVQLYGHQHSYERLWPLYNLTVCNGTDGPYVNPPAPVHVITGSAGCRERRDPFLKKIFPWSAFHTVEFGYTLLDVHNKTHLTFTQVSTDEPDASKVIDTFTVVKEKHGFESFHCHHKK